MFTYASVITNEAKKDIICRVLAGLAAMGVTDVYAMDDPKSLALAAAAVSFVLSISLWFTGHELQGIFVGLWVPSILSLGAIVMPRGVRR